MVVVVPICVNGGSKEGVQLTPSIIVHIGILRLVIWIDHVIVSSVMETLSSLVFSKFVHLCDV